MLRALSPVLFGGRPRRAPAPARPGRSAPCLGAGPAGSLLWQQTSGSYWNTSRMVALRKDEAKFIAETPTPPYHFKNRTMVFEVAPSFDSLRRYVWAYDWFLFCQTYVAAALTARPSQRASARDRVVWMLDVLDHIGSGLEALNAVPDYKWLAAPLSDGLWSGYEGRVVREADSRGVGHTPRPAARKFQNFSLSGAWGPYVVAFRDALRRNKLPDLMPVHQVQDNYDSWLRAEEKAWKQKSIGPLDSWEPPHASRPILLGHYHAEGTIPTAFGHRDHAVAPARGYRLSKATTVPGRRYLGQLSGEPMWGSSWIPGIRKARYEAPWKNTLRGVETFRNRAQAQGRNDLEYLQALNQWRVQQGTHGAQNEATLEQMIDGVASTTTTPSVHVRDGIATPNFAFHYDYGMRALAKAFIDTKYQIPVAKTFKHIVARTQESPVPLSEKDCKLIRQGRNAEVKAANEAAMLQGAGMMTALVGGMVAGGPVGALVAFAGSFFYTMFEGPRAKGCPTYGGCPGSLSAQCTGLTALSFFDRTLADPAVNLTWDHSLPTAQMWANWFAAGATNELLAQLDFGLDVCTKDLCLWSRDLAKEVASRPRTSIRSGKAPPPLGPQPNPVTAKHCTDLLALYEKQKRIAFSSQDRAALVNACIAEAVKRTAPPGHAIAVLKQIESRRYKEREAAHTAKLRASVPTIGIPPPRQTATPMVVGAGLVGAALLLRALGVGRPR